MTNLKIELRSISAINKDVATNLFQYYVYEMSGFLRLAPSGKGVFYFDQSTLDQYWLRDDHYPFFIYCDNEIAGFSLIRKYPADKSLYDMGQFFVLKIFKNKGVGRKAVELSVSKFPGAWLTRVLIKNTNALSFWLSVISKITDNNFTQTKEKDKGLEMHFIRYRIGSA